MLREMQIVCLQEKLLLEILGNGHWIWKICHGMRIWFGSYWKKMDSDGKYEIPRRVVDPHASSTVRTCYMGFLERSEIGLNFDLWRSDSW